MDDIVMRMFPYDNTVMIYRNGYKIGELELQAKNSDNGTVIVTVQSNKALSSNYKTEYVFSANPEKGE